MSDRNLLFSCAMVLAVVYGVFFPMATEHYHMYILVTPIACATSVLYVTSMSLLTLCSPKNKVFLFRISQFILMFTLSVVWVCDWLESWGTNKLQYHWPVNCRLGMAF